MEKKIVSLNELYPTIKQVLTDGGSVNLPITGTSMLPLLRWGRDSVVISPAVGVEIGDIIFYRRDNGQFVLHRIIGSDEKGYILCGDNQWVKEHGICDRHIIGKVSSITRKGKAFDINSKGYRFYCRLWKLLFPVRKPIVLVRAKLGELAGKSL